MLTFKLPRGRISDPRKMRGLFFLCWVAYVFTYLGRLNYSACLVEIMNTEGWSKAQAGLIATGFFTTYGLGQLVNGFIGDRLSPKIMVASGLAFSGLVNLFFPLMPSSAAAMVLWCINGFAQSMIWSPLVRQLSEWLPTEKRLRACANMNSTVPVGTLAVYGLSAVLVYLGNWKLVFIVSGGLLVTMAVIFFFGITKIEKQLEPAEDAVPEVKKDQPVRRVSMGRLILLSALPLCFVGLFMQGMLKDGVTTWIPTFLEENFGLTSAASILCTTVVPIINLSGVYLASWLNRRFFKNEVLGAMTFFLAALIALILLAFLPISSAVVSLILLAATTTFMMGINTLMASMMPSYYVQYGFCSTATGLLNAAAYIGCAVSTYGNGAIVERFGWNSIMYCWCIAAAVGAVVCGFAAKKWKSFRNRKPGD